MSPPFPPPGVKVLSVGELTRTLKGIIEGEFASVWVEGEVSNLARPASGHVYLTLKDAEAPLKAVVYRGVGLRLKFDLRDGMRVIARGRLILYVPRGEYQLEVEEVQPKGIGPLELAFRQLKEKLFARGYFDKARKKPLPRVPRRLAVVTSATGSAVRDVLEVLARRWPAVEVWVCPVRVQGEGAAEEISAALGWLNQVGRRPDTAIDAILVGRGGGSLEDLWPFNEERVADAIFASRIPIVTGIGHEDDLTIADLVADCRALTPTEAAERVVPDRSKVLEWLGERTERFQASLQRRLELARQRLDNLARRPCFLQPVERIRAEERRLDEWWERLERGARQRLEQAGQRLAAAVGRLEGVSPLSVLARGYSLTQREADGTLIHSAAQVRVGERVVTRVQDGRIVSRVEDIRDAGGSDHE